MSKGIKIIFLDIDGVLNSQSFYKIRYANKKEGQQFTYMDEFDQDAVKRLNAITDETGAKIVVSSTWRKSRTVGELRSLFKKVGISGKVIGKTPYLSYDSKDYSNSVPRGAEIKTWMEMNKGMLGCKIPSVRYVILDDDSDMLYWQRDAFFWCDNEFGLTNNIAYKVTNYLNRYD